MNYKEKYIKYKTKYLELKKMEQSGGDDSGDLYPTINIVNKFINSDKICKIINKKIGPILKKKIELNIYFVPWDLYYCEDRGDGFSDCHYVSGYNPDEEYLDEFHENWEDKKSLIVGLTAIIGNSNKKTKPKVRFDTAVKCFLNKWKETNLDLQEKIIIFETFDKYLPRHLSWSGSDRDEILIYYSPQIKKNLPKRLKNISEGISINKSLPNKKKDRPSPSESATQFKVGTKKKGNDGNMWIIVENKNGVKRWSKSK